MRRRAQVVVLGFCLSAAAAGLSAQEGAEAPKPVPRDGIGTRLVSLASPYPVRPRTFEVLFTHRFQQTIQDGDSHDLWGLDGGSDIGIGLSAGLTRRFDLSLYRSSLLEEFELAGKGLVFEQAPGVPLTASVRVGIDYLRRPGADDPNRPFVQLLLSRRLATGVHLLVSPSWVRGTQKLRNAVNVPLGLTFPVGKKRLLEIEVVPKNRDLEGSEVAWNVALSSSVGGHVFEVTLGNSRATTVDQALGGDFAGGFRKGDLRLGFNLVRDFYRSGPR